MILPDYSRPPLLHPEEELLVRFASGDLPLSRRAMIEGHLAFCPTCRQAIAEMVQVGGRHLKATVPLAPPSGLWSKIAARLPAAIPARPNPLAETPLPPGVVAELPARTAPLTWTTLPGSPVEICHFFREEELGLDLFLLQGPPSSFFPYHRHLGTEDLLILRGGLTDDYCHLHAGEMYTYHAGTAHEPQLDADEVCWALTAIGGGVDFNRGG